MDEEHTSNGFSLVKEDTLTIDGFPFRWVPLPNFFDPELPGFPLYRVHFFLDGRRIFGIPVTCSLRQQSGENCELEIHVLSRARGVEVCANSYKRKKPIIDVKNNLSLLDWI